MVDWFWSIDNVRLYRIVDFDASLVYVAVCSAKQSENISNCFFFLSEGGYVLYLALTGLIIVRPDFKGTRDRNKGRFLFCIFHRLFSRLTQLKCWLTLISGLTIPAPVVHVCARLLRVDLYFFLNDTHWHTLTVYNQNFGSIRVIRPVCEYYFHIELYPKANPLELYAKTGCITVLF